MIRKTGVRFLVDVNRVTFGEHIIQNWYPYFLMLFLLLAGRVTVIIRATPYATKK